jgi:hypothetical protein
LNVSPRGRISVLNVGQVRETVRLGSNDNRELSVVHQPKTERVNDPSHSEIENLKPDQELIAELVLRAVLEHHPARPQD